MRVDDGTVHERKIVVRFDEADIISALVERAASHAGLGIDLRHVRTDCAILRRDRPGTSGFESHAVVTLTIDLGNGDGQ